MAKFLIECPRCGRYTEVSTGLFAKRKIDCACGYTIDVKRDKVKSRVCPHCGNTVIFDSSKGDKALCPVCHEKINTPEQLSTLVEFSCPSCSCKLSADKNVTSYTCPLCDTVIDIQAQVSKEAVKNQGLASVIKYEGDNDVFVWKHPIEDFNLGSQLIVHESQEAIFFKDGQALDLFGSGRYTLSTQNLPLLEELYKLPFNTDTPFHSEVYFINLTTQMGIKWGTDTKVRVADPASGLYVELGARGTLNLRVRDSRKLLLKLVGTGSGLTQGELSEGLGWFKGLIISRVKPALAQVIREQSINVLEIDSYLDSLSLHMGEIINRDLEEYGLTIPEFYLAQVVTPDDDPDFKRLKQQFADRTLKIREEEIRQAEAEAARGRKLVEAETAAQLKMVGAQGEAEALKIRAMAEAEAYRAQAFAEAEEMRAKGYTYQQETARQVGLEAMKNGLIGEGGSGSLGDIASLGVTLGAMGGVIGMTKDALSPIMEGGSAIGSGLGGALVGSTGWDCACGNRGITTPFCPACGAKQPMADTWDCACGNRGISTMFCPNCGAKKPSADVWDCTCGNKGITTGFCPNCGAKKPGRATWDCGCGNKGISTDFCPACGSRRGEVEVDE